MEIVHTPVLLEETIHYLSPRKTGELMIDATLGEGGHSYAFLSPLRLLLFDNNVRLEGQLSSCPSVILPFLFVLCASWHRATLPLCLL